MIFQKLEAVCRAKGITEVEIYRIKAEGASISTFNGKVDKNEIYSKAAAADSSLLCVFYALCASCVPEQKRFQGQDGKRS